MPAAAETLPAALEEAARAEPDRVLLESDDRFLTVGELDCASAAIAARLRRIGIQRGDRVAVMLRNSPEFVQGWFGIIRAGAIEVPVHSAYKGPILEHVLSESEPRALIVEAEFLDRLAGLSLPSLERVIVRGESEDGPALPWLATPFAEFTAGEERFEQAGVTGRDTSCILYTSGTTGRSKGVVISHAANLRLARTVIDLMEYERDDVLYTAFPLFHVNAKFTSVMPALLTGARLVLDDRFSASRFWQRMRSAGVTAFNYMGSMLTILAKQPERDDDAENPVRRCYGAACPPSLWEKFERRFEVELREHYGMTEIGIATMNTRTERRVGSIGRAAPYFEVRIADENDVEVPDGETGEIQVRPREPGVMFDHYWGRLDATAESFRNLWFHTGDHGRRDADGFFYFVDRAKDCIRRRGENVSSFEVESVINTHPTVLESAAFAVPSELGEDELAVAVVPREGHQVEPLALLEYCRSRLPYFAVPRYVTFRAAIPKNSSQRIQKFKLREEGVTSDAFDAEAAGFDPRVGS